ARRKVLSRMVGGLWYQALRPSADSTPSDGSIEPKAIPPMFNAAKEEIGPDVSSIFLPRPLRSHRTMRGCLPPAYKYAPSCDHTTWESSPLMPEVDGENWNDKSAPESIVTLTVFSKPTAMFVSSGEKARLAGSPVKESPLMLTKEPSPPTLQSATYPPDQM